MSHIMDRSKLLLHSSPKIRPSTNWMRLWQLLKISHRKPQLKSLLPRRLMTNKMNMFQPLRTTNIQLKPGLISTSR